MSNFLSDLPTELIPFQSAIASSIIDCLKIKISPQKNRNLFIENKIGGLPYLPVDKNYPINDQGEYLRLVAQLNFAKIPPLKNFPQQGILQFFIESCEHKSRFYGLDFNNPTLQTGYKIIYYSDISESIVTNFDFLGNLEEDYLFPIQGEFSLNFSKEKSIVTPYNEDFNDYLPELSKAENQQLLELYINYYDSKFNEAVHQLGGHPMFTQSDPRIGEFKTQEPYQLLLQIDSEYCDQGYDICWGDCGIANFFIHPSDLKNLNFSKVLYNWDCS